MTCNEINCRNLSCALCYDCQQSLCLHHVILHHDILVERHLSFYELLQQLYHKLQSMSIEQCYQQVFEQLTVYNTYSADILRRLRSLREELVEQLNRFKQKQFGYLQRISSRLNDTKQMIHQDEANDIKEKLEQIQTSINSLVYGIHLDMCKTTKTIQCRKIFHHQTSITDKKLESSLQKSFSWTNGSTENYWKNKNDFEERSSLF